MCLRFLNGWGNDMNLSFSFAPYVPVLVLAVLAILGLLLVGYAAVRRSRGWWLRGIALALLLASLANPSLRQEEREPLRNIGIVIVDHSESQRIGNRLKQADAAADALKQVAAGMKDLDLRFVTVEPSSEDSAKGTRLFKALERALGDVPADRFAGSIMITDGAVHDVPEASAPPVSAGAPLHGLISGSRKEIDRRIVIEQAPRFGIVGKQQVVRFRLEETGSKGAPVDVLVRFGNGREQTLSVVPGQSTELPMELDHAGDNVAEISVAPLPDEITLENNRALAVINGVRDRLRVLLVSGEPHLGERTWRNMLKADAAVDLVHFTILRPPDKQDGTPVNELSLIAFPTRELFVDKIREFDLVIFDRYHREAIIPDDYVRQIAEYVQEGGALLVASGPEFAEFDGLFSTPLSDVLAASPTGDVQEGAFKPRLTTYGDRHPVTAGLGGIAGSEPTWGRWFRTVSSNASEPETLMTGLDGKPLLVLSHQREGRSAQLLSDQSWLWARGFEGGGPQAELLRRMAHWLMKEPSLEEEALSGRLENGTLTVERRTLLDKTDPVTVTSPSGKQETVDLQSAAPGLWRGTLKTTEQGLYRLDDGKLKSVAISKAGDSLEASDILATAARLEPAAARSGGAVSWLEDGLPRLQMIAEGRPMNARGTIGLKANGTYRVVAATTYPLFSSLLALAAALLLVCAAWFREGR